MVAVVWSGGSGNGERWWEVCGQAAWQAPGGSSKAAYILALPAHRPPAMPIAK